MEFAVNDLQSYFPSLWSYSEQYEKQLYVLVTLDSVDVDYKDIYQLFKERKPTKIERVQQPIAYLRYMIQSEYLKELDIPYTESLKYIEIDHSKIDICLKYNCDDRYVKGNIVFGNSPPQHSYNPVILVKKRQCSIETDKNHFPLYIVHF